MPGHRGKTKFFQDALRLFWHILSNILGADCYMKNEIDAFIGYMQEQKQISDNTAAAYTQDLCKLTVYMHSVGMDDFGQVDTGVLQAYLHELEVQGRKAATVSRVIASMKAFFTWQCGQGVRDQPSSGTPKELRDKAMMELLYATGIRVSELLALQLGDVNLQLEYVTCRDGRKERTIPFGSNAREALDAYLKRGRPRLVDNEACQLLFTNCSGEPMSRQGFWKLLKHYGRQAGLTEEITPHTIRHSFAAHLLNNGADLKSVQELMGHSDISSTQIYMQLSDRTIREVYKQTHPRV